MVHKKDKVLTLRLVNKGEKPTASIEKCQAEGEGDQLPPRRWHPGWELNGKEEPSCEARGENPRQR